MTNLPMQHSLHDRLRDLIPSPVRRITRPVLVPCLSAAGLVFSVPRSLRGRKLAQAERSGNPFVARIPTTRCRMRLDPTRSITKTWFVDGDFEPGMISVMRHLVKPGMTCFDLGANAGYYTLFLAKAVGNTGTVYAFEPTRETHESLVNNLELNRAGNVLAENRAIGDYCGEIAFHEGPRGYDVYNTVGTLLPSLGPVATRFTTRKVAITTLDQYCLDRHIQKVDFIKLDIEGGEMAALRGAERVIANNPSLSMVLEVSPDLAQACGHSAEEILNWLAERSFRLYLLSPTGKLGVITDISSISGNVVAIR